MEISIVTFVGVYERSLLKTVLLDLGVRSDVSANHRLNDTLPVFRLPAPVDRVLV